MSAHPIVIVDEELLRKVPKEYQGAPRYQKGASLELVPVALPAESSAAGDLMSQWESLRGILAPSGLDPNGELHAEKQRELEDEARWKHA